MADATARTTSSSLTAAFAVGAVRAHRHRRLLSRRAWTWLHEGSTTRPGRWDLPAKKKQKAAAESGKAVKVKKKKTSRGK